MVTPVVWLAQYGPAISSAVKSVGSKVFNNMGLFSSIFGGNSNSAELSYQYSKKLQQHQYELNRLTRQTAFQDTRQSLEESGYNPLLAVNQQAQGGTYGASMNVTDPNTERLNNKMAMISQLVNIAQQRSQSKLNSAQSALAQTQSDVGLRQLALQEQRNSAEVANIEEQTRTTKLNNDILEQTGLDKAQQEINLLIQNANSEKERQKLLKVQRVLTNTQVGEVKATINQTKASTSAIKAQADREKILTGDVKRHPKYYQRMQRFGIFTGSVGNVFSGSAGISGSAGVSKKY